MSTYLSLYLKEKEATTLKNAVCVLWFSASSARDIADQLELDYTHNEPFKKLTANEISDFVNYFAKEIRERKRRIEESEKELAVSRNLLPKCENKDAFNSIYEICNDIETGISFDKEELDTETYRYHEFRVLSSMIEDESNKNFEVVYTLS